MIVCRVQAHPERKNLLPRLLSALEPLPTEVFTHSSEPPNPWENYYRCLSDLPECSHVLIVQDDAMPVPHFSEVLPTIGERFPSNPVCLFLGGQPSATAAKARQVLKVGRRRYIPLGRTPFMPLVATLWPRSLAEDFRVWSESAKHITRADDGNAGRWMRENAVQVMATVPSIVEHDDWINSVKGGRKATWGHDRGRVAALLAEDAALYHW